MKVSKSKCNRKKNPFKFDSVKNSFWVHKVSGIKILQYFQIFTKSCSVVFEKKLTLLHLPYENF